MLADGVSEPLQLAVDAPFAQGWFECDRVKEDIDVFRETLDKVPAFRQAGAALEDHFVTCDGGDDTKGFGDVVILLNDRWA
jgi:hypothetical protein